MGADDFAAQIPGLMASYVRLEQRQALTEQLIEERSVSNARRLDGIDAAVAAKADAKDVIAIADELKSIKRWLMALVMCIVAASIGFGFAALQIAGGAP